MLLVNDDDDVGFSLGFFCTTLLCFAFIFFVFVFFLCVRASVCMIN